MKSQETTLDQRFNKLKDIISKYRKVCIGYSGGVDSTLLLYLANQMIPTVAITIDGPMVTRQDIAEAQDFTSSLEQTEHIIYPVNPFEIDEFVRNASDRCYYCKKTLFSLIRETASEKGCEVIFDGANIDDLGDYRPGMKATEELGILSPFLEAGLNKSDIYYLSKKFNLPTKDKPSAACLASRVPTGEELSPEKLNLIEEGERVLKEYDFSQLRLRLRDGKYAMIECSESDFPVFEDNRTEIIRRLEALGVKVSENPKAYRQGSMNIIK